MKIAIAQFDAVIGDFRGNHDRMVAFAGKAAAAGADLVLFPELSVCGYPPNDLLDQGRFIDRCEETVRSLQRSLPRGIAAVVGYVDRNRSGAGKPLVNAMAVIRDGRIDFVQRKTLLPTYDVFDESRYFEPAKERRVFELCGKRIGIAICEDIWWEEPPVPGMRYGVDPVRDLLDAGAELILAPSASPFHADKLAIRRKLVSRVADQGETPVVYCNLTGANESLVFDGRSFAVDGEGRLLAIAGWDEELLVVDPFEGGPISEPPADRWGDVVRAMVEGIRSYMKKCGFKKAHLGLSGGIDSALVAVLAAEAIGPDNVTCVGMPSRFSSQGSVDHSRELCEKLGVAYEILPIEKPFASYLDLFTGKLGGELGLTAENLQARIRGNILMAWSNEKGSMLLTTGNKSEIAVGYCTLYGDMCGAFNPIGDLLKTEVYAVCRRINERKPVIPASIIDKAPSAELRPNQLDQDSLPPYDVLDAVLERFIVRNLDPAAIVAEGFDRALVKRVVGLVAKSEFKRRQAAPVVKLSPRAFGMGRRVPIARAFHELED